MSYKYLIDANVFMSSSVRQSIEVSFFRERCIVLDEIAHELLDTSIYGKAKKLAVPVDGRVLPYLTTVVDEMVALGLVKTDEGNGEALLISWGLMMQDDVGNQPTFDFMKDQPVIVTNETKVLQFAKTKGLDSIDGDNFITLLNHGYSSTGLNPEKY